jgi:ABC-type amino acid transport substrate-binding protein
MKISSSDRRLWGVVGFLFGVIALTGFQYALVGSPSHPSGASVRTQSSLEEIKKRGFIRCGYVSNPPACIINPNTKELSGIFVEAIEKVAQSMGVGVKWTEEVAFGSMIEGIKTGRYDVVPCGIWPTGARSLHADFSIPLYYSGVGIYVRADDDRFGGNLKAMNSPDVTIATIDGEMAQAIARTDFPKAKTVGLPQLSDISTMLLNVKNKKADVAFVELYFAYEFLRNNPGSLKNIAPQRPVRIFPNTVLLKQGDYEFKSALNASLEELVNLGILDGLLNKYEPVPGTFYRLNLPYRLTP